jgi:hypothetical protein
MKIAAEICVYANDQFVIEELWLPSKDANNAARPFEASPSSC